MAPGAKAQVTVLAGRDPDILALQEVWLSALPRLLLHGRGYPVDASMAKTAALRAYRRRGERG